MKPLFGDEFMDFIVYNEIRNEIEAEDQEDEMETGSMFEEDEEDE